MRLSKLALFLATAGAVPSTSHAKQSRDGLTVQINLDHHPEPASTRCEQLCDQGEVYCKANCKTDECKAACAFSAGICRAQCGLKPPSPPKDGNGSPYCIPTCMEGHFICLHDGHPRVECDYKYNVCRAKCDVDDD